MTENGKNIELAQQIFALFYLVHLGVVFKLYHLISNELKMPPLYLVFVSLTGYRMHSIFALRLFNDGPAMTIFYLSIISFVYRKWRLGKYFFTVRLLGDILFRFVSLLPISLNKDEYNIGSTRTFDHLSPKSEHL